MNASLTHNHVPESRGQKKVERPFLIEAEPVMDCVAAIDDECKLHAELARMKFAEAAEHQRRARALSSTRMRLTGAIAATERVA
jgi:hypothetical protein